MEDLDKLDLMLFVAAGGVELRRKPVMSAWVASCDFYGHRITEYGEWPLVAIEKLYKRVAKFTYEAPNEEFFS